MIASQVVRGRGVARGMTELTYVSIAPTTMRFTEQVLFGDSSFYSETLSRAETVIITNA